MTKSALQQNLTACLHYCTATIGIRRMVVYVWDEILDDLKSCSGSVYVQYIDLSMVDYRIWLH